MEKPTLENLDSQCTENGGSEYPSIDVKVSDHAEPEPKHKHSFGRKRGKPFEGVAVNSSQCNEALTGVKTASLEPCVVTSRHSNRPASVLCTNCGDVITFEQSCSDKFCGVCNARRQRSLMRLYKTEIEKMEHPKFLTLTVLAKPLSKELMASLRKALSRLMHRKGWKAKAGFYVIELGTFKDTGLWNIHFHMVLDSAYMDQGWISKTWLEITGDSMVVWINQVRSYRYAVQYLTKYIAKPVASDEELTQGQKDFVNRLLKGVRRIQRFGTAISPKSMRQSICRKCGAIKSYISVQLELEPSIQGFDKGVSAFKKIRNTRADAIESFDWWTFEGAD